MKKLNKLQKIINNTACPDGFIYHIEQEIEKYNKENIFFFRKHILLIIKILLEKKVIKAVEPFSENYDEWLLKPEDIINKIDKKWKKDIEHEDYYNIVWLNMADNFKEKIIKDGYIIDTDWNTYLNKTPWLQKLLHIDEDEFIKRLDEV